VKRLFISDCEGPISKNDNAFELASQFLPNGDRLFATISKYDDIIAYILKRPGYRAGYTLKLILPFLKAFDVTDQMIREFSAQNLMLVSNAAGMLQYIGKIAHAFIVSTSYEHYIKVLCKKLSFPYENTYCTKMSLDHYELAEGENKKLKQYSLEISRMPVLEITQDVKSLEDFPTEQRAIIHRLDEIFWNEIPEMKIGLIFQNVMPVGSGEKAEAVVATVEKLGTGLRNVMYIGDSVTDVEALRLVAKNRGLAISFNGNRYAVANANIAILSEDSIITTLIADVFCRFGREEALSLVQNWSRDELKDCRANKILLSRLLETYPTELPKARIVSRENVDALSRESTEFRKRIRGEAVGGLG